MSISKPEAQLNPFWAADVFSSWAAKWSQRTAVLLVTSNVFPSSKVKDLGYIHLREQPQTRQFLGAKTA